MVGVAEVVEKYFEIDEVFWFSFIKAIKIMKDAHDRIFSSLEADQVFLFLKHWF